MADEDVEIAVEAVEEYYGSLDQIQGAEPDGSSEPSAAFSSHPLNTNRDGVGEGYVTLEQIQGAVREELRERDTASQTEPDPTSEPSSISGHPLNTDKDAEVGEEDYVTLEQIQGAVRGELYGRDTASQTAEPDATRELSAAVSSHHQNADEDVEFLNVVQEVEQTPTSVGVGSDEGLPSGTDEAESRDPSASTPSDTEEAASTETLFFDDSASSTASERSEGRGAVGGRLRRPPSRSLEDVLGSCPDYEARRPPPSYDMSQEMVRPNPQRLCDEPQHERSVFLTWLRRRRLELGAMSVSLAATGTIFTFMLLGMRRAAAAAAGHEHHEVGGHDAAAINVPALRTGLCVCLMCDALLLWRLIREYMRMRRERRQE